MSYVRHCWQPARWLGPGAALAAQCLAAPMVAAQSGTVIGSVTDSATRTAIPAAAIQVIGTGRGVTTTNDGHYRLSAIPRGPVRLRVTRLGYAAASQTVVVPADSVITVDFTLTATQVTLDQVVVTATGSTQRERENGSTVATISADSVNKAAVSTFSDLVAGKAAGVSVATSAGEPGSGTRIRVRGSNSVSLPNDPLLIVDGVRVSNDVNSQGRDVETGGQTPSRFDDLNPDDIESIEVLKGPAASALYGTAGANGVLLVTTRKGVGGRVRRTAHADYGTVTQSASFPANYGQVGTAGGGRTTQCTLFDQGAGNCTKTPDSLLVFNPLESRYTAFSSGNRRVLFGGSIAGGGDATNYYVSGDYDNTHGLYPNNFLLRNNARANVQATPSPVLDFGINANYLQVRGQLPPNDNDRKSSIGSALFGAPYNSPTHGYAFLPPAVSDALIAAQNVEHFTGGTHANWRPIGWLTVTGLAGVDLTDRDDGQLFPTGILPPAFGGLAATGYAASDVTKLWTYTAQLTAAAQYALAPSLNATSSIGTQYTNEVTRGTFASGYGLAAGTASVAAATNNFTAGQLANEQVVTIGYYAQQALAWHDRLFLTGALRADDNSAFGQRFTPELYPSVSGSWVIGEEPWFPRQRLVSSLRLRAAFGYSGQHPGFQQAQTFYTAVAYHNASGEVGAVTLGGIGNADLKPERSHELEAGFDAGFIRDHVNLQVTGYSKTTTDALVAVNLAPSVGGVTVGANAGTSTRFANLGEVTNRGIEVLLSAALYQTSATRVDITVNGSLNKNKLVTLGPGISPIVFGAASITGVPMQEQRNGYPLGGYWQQPYIYRDVNHDGIIEANEVTVADAARYEGDPFPQALVSINPSVTVLRYLRISALFDHHGIVSLFNQTSQFRCSIVYPFTNCQADYDPRTPLARQAAIQADAAGSDAGFIENASFWKWRELSVTLSAPPALTDRLRLQHLSFTVAGRNLHTWTSYSGSDPEVNYLGQSNFGSADFLTQPALRYWTGRFDITL